MKSQHIAVIFIIIILPIAMVLSYTIGKQIDTIKIQNQYNTSLNDATYDAVQAFQINTVNNRYSTISASKIRDIEASVNTFFTSLSDNEPLTEEQLKSYVPALVYTLYDGYYIYSKYDNIYPTNNGQPILDENQLKQNDANYGLKPYIYYSCRYRTNNKDFIVNYTLDNAITVYGNLGNGYETKSGYLINPNYVKNVSYNEGNPLSWKLTYDDVLIIPEQLTEHIVFKDGTEGEYDYVVYNGQKVYYDKDAKENNKTTKYFYYQDYNKSYIPTNNEVITYLQDRTIDDILYSTSSFEYYYNAYNFSVEINDDIGDIKQSDAVDADGGNIEFYLNTGDEKIFKLSEENDPLISTSIFNENRMAVIRNSIETNLVAAIANYNVFSSNTYEFKLPVLYEYEWEKITNNVSVISFLQGIPIGYKYYNNYCVLTNNDNEEVVKKENIYIIAESENKEREYHLPGCEHLLELKNVSYEASAINNTYSLSSSSTNLSQPKIEIIGENNVTEETEEKLEVKIISDKSIGAIQGKINTNEYINIIDIVPKNNWSKVIYENGSFIYTKADGTKGQEEIILEIKYKGINSTEKDVNGKVTLTNLILGEIINENQTRELTHNDVEKNITVKKKVDYEIQLLGENNVDAGKEEKIEVKIISDKSIGAIQGKIKTNEYINIIDIVPKNNWSEVIYENGNFIYTNTDGTKGQEEIILEIIYKGTNSTGIDVNGKVTLTNLILGEIINDNQTRELTHDDVEKNITVKKKVDYEIQLLGKNSVDVGTEEKLEVKIISNKSIGAIQGKINTNEYINIIDIVPKNNWNKVIYENGSFIYTKTDGTKGQEEIILEIIYKGTNSTGKDVNGKVTLTNLILGEIINENQTRELTHDDVEKTIIIKDREGLYTIAVAYPNISFLRQTVRISEGNYLYFYPLTRLEQPYLTSCYYCIVNSNNSYEVEDIIKGEIIVQKTDENETKINSQNNSNFKIIRELYIRALGRERNHLYQVNMESFNT